MRIFWISLAAFALVAPGSLTASAQPGGTDLPVDALPAAQPEPPPPLESAPPQPAGPPAQVMQPQGAPARATFVSTDEQQWDVWVDRQAMCATPCTLGLSTMQFVALRTQERNPVRLDVGYIPQGDVMISARPLQKGRYAAGIVFTTFSGMALATGVTLAAVGWGIDNSNMRTAGLITGVSGAVGLYGSIYLMRSALPRLSVGPAQPYATSNQVGLAGRF